MINRVLPLLLTLCLPSIPAGASAKGLSDAIAAMRSGDFAEAYCIMRPLADDGDADSQYNIGWMYHNGYGLRSNDSLALQWWMKASDQGHTDASFSVAMLYSLGDGEVKKDMGKAVDFYLIAADEGLEDAVTILKSMMLRNDADIRSRMHAIAESRRLMFGDERKVRVARLNARSENTTDSEVLAKLVSGETVLELNKKGRWSQVLLLEQPSIERTVWVYNPLLEKQGVGEQKVIQKAGNESIQVEAGQD